MYEISNSYRIYIVRQLLDSFYRHRINKTQAALEAFQKERDDTIGKLKEATKYDRTHQLLKKYGGELQPKQSKQTKRPTVPKERGRRDARERASFSAVQDRTGLPPPPTANIPRPMTADAANAGTPTVPAPQQQPSSLQSFSSSMPLTEYSEPKWYDRLLDVLLGEDEMNPRNRLALICVQCRMVNGQAAPGLRTLEEVGPWRCGYCGSWNGKPQGQSRAPSPLLEPPTDDMAGQVRQRSISQPVTSSSPVIEVSPPNDEAVEDGPTPDESETADESNDHDGDHNGKYDDSESSLANGNHTPTKANEGSAEGSIASRTRSKSPRTPNR